MKDIQPQDLKIVKLWRKELEQQAREQELEQGLEQGLISQRQTVLKLTAARFPALAALAQEQVDQQQLPGGQRRSAGERGAEHGEGDLAEVAADEDAQCLANRAPHGTALHQRRDDRYFDDA